MNYNLVIIGGRITRDPEVKYTANGKAICKFTVVVNRQWKTESGEKREEAAFIDVDSFGKQAEVIAQYFKKGANILVEGRLKQDNWEDKTTHQKRSKLGVSLAGFSFIDGKGEKQESPEPPELAPQDPADGPDYKPPF